LTLTVNDTAPATLAYDSNSASYTISKSIAANHATVTGGHANLRYRLQSGSLPSGLALDSLTGDLSGIPTALGTSTPTIRVSNTGGFADRALTLTVNDTAPATLTYDSNSASYTINKGITANHATVTGGHANLAISPAVGQPAFGYGSGLLDGFSLRHTHGAGDFESDDPCK